MTKKRYKHSRLSKPLLGLIAVSLLVGILYFSYQLTLTRPAPLEINAINTNPRLVELSLSSSDNQTVTININPGGASVTAAQFAISYDPAQLGNATPTLGEFFFTKLGEPKQDNGLLTFAAGVAVESGGKSSSGKAATIKFSKKPTSPTTIFVTKNTQIAAVSYASNILKNSASITLSPTAAATTTTTVITETVAPNPASAAQVSTNNNPQSLPAQAGTIQSTPKPNLITQLVNSVTKPTTTTPSQNVPTATPSDALASPRTFADTSFGDNTVPTPPETTSPSRDSWLVRLLNWFKSLLASLSDKLQ